MAKDFSRCPSSVRSPGCHGWSTLPVTLCHLLATSFTRLHERHSEGLVRTHKVIVGAPPLEVSQEVWRLLSCSPGATSQRGYSVSDGQIHALNKGGVQPSRKTHPL